MKFQVGFIILIFSLFTSSLVSAFEIYGFIPWKLQLGDELIPNRQQVNQILEQKGIKTIDVVYHNRMLTNGQVDSEKIKKIALKSKENPEIPISFDFELGDRFKPETVLPKLLTIIDLYHANGGKAPIGFYAILPQNTYGGVNLNSSREAFFSNLNRKYEIIATKVDFISPVFYFYNGENLDDWKKSVDFNMSQSVYFAKKYNLKIYPYITNSFGLSKMNPITKGWTIKLINQSQMTNILNYLACKGADGVIIWASSQVVDINGIKPEIQFNQPWFKGIKNFTGTCQ